MMAYLRRRKLVLLGLALALLLAGCAEMAIQDDVGGVMREGQELYRVKKFDEAIQKFQALIAQDGRHWQAYLWLARCYIAKGAWSDAVAAARRAYEIAPSGQDVISVFAEALFGGGSEALRVGKFQDAIALFTDYIKLQPGNARAYLNVGRALLGEKRFADALDALLKGIVVALSGNDRADILKALIDGGAQALGQGEFRTAITFLTEYLKIDPANMRAYVDIAKAYIGTGDYAQALQAYVRGLAQASEKQDLLQELLNAGRQSLGSGRTREAIAFLREYVRYDRTNFNAYLELARSYWRAGERLNALDAFRRVLELNPRHEEALRFLRGG